MVDEIVIHPGQMQTGRKEYIPVVALYPGTDSSWNVNQAFNGPWLFYVIRSNGKWALYEENRASNMGYRFDKAWNISEAREKLMKRARDYARVIGGALEVQVGKIKLREASEECLPENVRSAFNWILRTKHILERTSEKI